MQDLRAGLGRVLAVPMQQREEEEEEEECPYDMGA